ncbi:unnamed protein product [Brassica rapa subsp. narinosa]
MAPNEKTQRWLNNTDCCFWDGVSCDLKTGNVVDLDLFGSSLNGSLLSNSGNLSYLTHLDLQGNGFTGELPESMGKLNRLSTLDEQAQWELSSCTTQLNRAYVDRPTF